MKVFGNGFLDIGGHNAPGVSIGSIQGSGLVFLGALNLTVGSNNRSTNFSGLIQDGGRFEHHDPSRRDRHFLARLGVAPDPLAPLAYHERSERGKLHRLTALETIGDLLKHQLDQRRALGSRQAHLPVDRLAQVHTRHRFPSHSLAPLSAIRLNGPLKAHHRGVFLVVLPLMFPIIP